MDTLDLSDVIHELAGPGRSWDELARVLNITPATAYQWLRYASGDGFPATKTVRGDDNRLAKGRLLQIRQAIDSGRISPDASLSFLEYLNGSSPAPESDSASQPTDDDRGPTREELRKLGKGIEKILLDQSASPRQMLQSIRALVDFVAGE